MFYLTCQSCGYLQFSGPCLEAAMSTFYQLFKGSVTQDYEIRLLPEHKRSTLLSYEQLCLGDVDVGQRWSWDSFPLHWISCVHIWVSPLPKAAAPSTGAPQSSSLHTTSASCWSKTASHTDIHVWSWSISNLPEQREPPIRRTPETKQKKKTWTLLRILFP